MKRLRRKTTGIIVHSDYKRWHTYVLYAAFFLVLALTLLVTVFPPLWLFLSSFKTPVELYRVPFTLFPDEIRLSKVYNVWRMLGFGRYFINSLIVVAGAILASIFFNGLLAYAVSVIKPKGYRLVFALVMISLMIPPILNMGTLFHNIVRLGLINTYVPLWLVFGANPFYFIMFKAYFDRLPKALFEAAEIDGANKIQVFFRILMPLSKPIVGVVSIFTLNAAWSDFLLPFLVLLDDPYQTVMVKIFKLHSDLGTAMGFSPDILLMVLALSIIPPVVLFFIFQKQITSAVATTGIKE